MPDTPTWSLIARGANNNTWHSVKTVTDPLTGRQWKHTNTIEELASGLNYFDGQMWQPSQEVIEVFVGGARAIQGQTRMTLPANLNVQAALTVTFANDESFTTTPTGIAYTDLATGESIWLAELKDCQGEVHQPRTVVYPDAFDTLKADVHYVYERDRIEAFVTLLERPPPPEVFGLDSASTVLECWTEVYSIPASTKQTHLLPDGLTDESFNLGGQMHIGAGKAFLLGAGPDSPDAARVAKTWVSSENRSFIVESVRYPSVQAQLLTLPLAEQAANGRPAFNRQALRLPAVRQANLNQQKPMQMAALAINTKGLAIDWTGITSTVSNYTFEAGKTYAVTGNYNCDGTTTTEGGCVIKSTNNAGLTVRGPLVSSAGPYRPVVLTSWHDNSVGETLPGSTGTPTNRLSGPALKLDTYTYGYSYSLQYFRVSHATTGIQLFGGTSNEVRHVQFVNCGSPLHFYYANALVHNALFVNSEIVFGGTGTSTARVEHVTVSQAGTLVSTIWTGNNRVWMTNCVLAAVTNFGSGYFTNESVNVVLTNVSAFEASGAASCYLADGSTLRRAGTTNINSTLAGELRRKTTFRPATLSGAQRGDLQLIPTVPRGSSTPDIGYYYDPIDWAINDVVHTNGVVTIAPGTVLAACGVINNQPIGWVAGPGSQLLGQGKADQMIRIVNTDTVQEGSTTNGLWQVFASVYAYADDDSVPLPIHRLRFIKWDRLAGPETYHFYGNVDTTLPVHAEFRDNQFYNSTFLSDSVNLGLTNNLFDACTVKFSDYVAMYANSTNITVALRNNTFSRGSVEFVNNAGRTNWFVQDNFFACTNLYQNASNVTNDHNGYITNAIRLMPMAASDKTNLLIAWRAGPLGNFYQLTSSALINAGSTYATNAGLYHFTIATNLVKEAATTVDIGFHYGVTDGNGVPSDTDGDGVPDWLEDLNGNGGLNSGETDWNSATDRGLKVFITQPRDRNGRP